MDWSKYLEDIDLAWNSLVREALENRLLEIAAEVRSDHDKESWIWGAMQNELGTFYRGMGRYAEAESCFQQAVDILERCLGRETPAYATALNNLAGTHRLSQQLDKADVEFRQCLELYISTVGKNHILYASGLNNLSLVCLDQGDLPQAASLQGRAVEILAALPDRRDELAASLNNLGILYQRAGRLAEAEEKLVEALRMFREELGTNTPHYHAALNALGTVCYRQGRFEDAETNFAAAAEAALAMFGPDHHETREAYEHVRLARRAQEVSS